MKNHKALVAIIGLLLIVSGFNQVKATGYFFSTSDGDDSRTAAQAQNASTPWRSIAKLNAIINSLGAGDAVYFKRGDVFDGAIAISVSGAAGNPIVFDAYGAGEKPVISGFASLSNWAYAGGNIWETAVASASGTINVVVWNGAFRQTGRYPNITAVNGGYLTINSFSANNSITDQQLAPNPDWSGGEVVIRKNRWVLDRNKIISHNGHTINYTSQSGYSPSANYGYFIQNHPKALDVDGEWYHDNSSKKFGIYSASGAPFNVQASVVRTLVSITNQSNISFRNISFKGANQNAFELNNAYSIQLLNCDVLFSGSNAVLASGCNNLDVEGCTIYHTNNTALELRGSSNAVIKGNKIKATGTAAGLGGGDSGSYEGILMDGDNELVEGNEIDSTGYIPITFRGNTNIIKNNFISNYTLVKDDGGGIYTWNNIAGAPPTYGSKIIGNILINAFGAGAGTDAPAYQAANGIYMDDNTAGVEIKGNSIANCGLYGLYVHNGHDLIIADNTFYSSSSQVVLSHDNYASNAPVRNVTMTNNIFFAKDNSQLVAEFYSPNNDIPSFGTFDNNFYCRPTFDSYIIGTSNLSNGVYLDLADWKAQYGKDQSSVKSPVSIASYDYSRFEYNASANAKSITLDGTYVDARNTTYNGNITLAPFSSAVLMKVIGSTSFCPGTGSITREQWNGIPGGGISSIPFQTTPAKTAILSGALETSTIGDNYGDRIRGYICPPQTGAYTFWIAADDAAELWLSTDGNSATKRKIAYTSGWTGFREWNKYSSQKSATINLQAGQKYYIEVLHKEGGGGDHLSVGWTLPDGTLEAPIAGTHLSPNGTTSALLDQSISFPVLSNTILGSSAVTLTATASSGLPVSYSIISGPATLAGNVLNPTGVGIIVIKAAQAGNSQYNPAPDATQQLLVLTASVAVTCSGTGSILREQWNGVGGNDVPQIPLASAPSSSSQLTSFEGPKDIADAYGSRIRGYVCAPQTGYYTFLIAGDDATELWLSSDVLPANKIKIAYNLSWTGFREWYKYSTQQSGSIYLIAGQKYYIEALHKEGGGGDHLSVAWKLPDGTMEAPIAGSHLSPYQAATVSLLSQTINFPSQQNIALGSGTVTLTATASSGLPVSYSIISGPATLNGNVLTPTGSGTIIINASQSGNTLYNPAADAMQQIVVTPAPVAVVCSGTGSILREQWNGVAGNDVVQIPILLSPSSTSQVTSFEGPQDVADAYGSRIRGYICPPQTGYYTFWIAGDDGTELWLSTDDNVANKTRIAYSLNWTGFREWSRYATQKSAGVYLVAGQKYYVEALQKEGVGGDHLSVGWTLPNGTFEAPIAGSRLSPYVVSTVVTASQTITFLPLAPINFGAGTVTLAATASSGLPVSYSVVAGPGTLAGNVLTPTGIGAIIIKASQAGNGLYSAAPDVSQTLVVQAAGQCAASGTILREQWNGIAGNDVAQIPVTISPSSTSQLTKLEGPEGVSDNYGSRIRGYICPPQSGAYTFWIAGDDATELWLSTDDDPSNKIRIAYNQWWTGFRDWYRYGSQKSAAIYLEVGKRYYVEVLQKEGAGSDHVSVGWTLPTGVFEAPIAGMYLSPYATDNSGLTTTRLVVARETALPVQEKIDSTVISKPTLTAYPNPFSHQTTIVVAASQTGTASLEVYDISGRLIRKLFNGAMQKGEQKQLVLDDKNLSSGTYFIRFASASGIINYKVVRSL